MVTGSCKLYTASCKLYHVNCIPRHVNCIPPHVNCILHHVNCKRHHANCVPATCKLCTLFANQCIECYYQASQQIRSQIICFEFYFVYFTIKLRGGWHNWNFAETELSTLAWNEYDRTRCRLTICDEIICEQITQQPDHTASCKLYTASWLPHHVNYIPHHVNCIM
jgi:hypothetical protein